MQFGAESGKPGTSLIPQASPNRNVKWDVSDKFNLGFDTRFFDGRLSAVFDFYYDINDNILNQFMASQPGIPIYAGGSYAEENFGRVDTYGGELSLTWRDKIGKVNYNIGMDFGLSGSKVKEWVPVLRYNKYPCSSSWEEGMSTYLPVWGFKVWKGTSMGDGILRTQEDINNYWYYLESWTPEGGQTKYLDKTSKDDLRPGMVAYQDLGGEMVNGYLTISAAKGLDKEEKDEKDGKYIRKERYSGAMSRSFYVGDELKQEDIKAKYEDGILKLSVPKKEQKKVETTKHIAIEG